MPDSIRISRNRQGLMDGRLDALICALPSDVLLLSGYWPVVGMSIAIATIDRIVLLVPEDEAELAANGWADDIHTFKTASLQELITLDSAVEPALRDAIGRLNLSQGRIAYEATHRTQPASYAAMNFYGGSMRDLLQQAAPDAHLQPARELLNDLRLIKTPHEISMIRQACAIVGRAFAEGIGHVRPRATETRVAAHFRAPLMASGDKHRADGFAYCMSGPNAAEAYKAFQRSRQRELRKGDLVLVHCNSYAAGYWTDVTRTYALGSPDERGWRMYDAILSARQAALSAIRPGARAADVDHAARQVMADHGFGPQFLHPTGHGTGFAAIDHNAQPRLHPKSPDVLQTGMVFNVEPGAYFKGECGMRHCDMVAVSAEGADILTPFQDRKEMLVLS